MLSQARAFEGKGTIHCDQVTDHPSIFLEIINNIEEKQKEKLKFITLKYLILKLYLFIKIMKKVNVKLKL